MIYYVIITINIDEKGIRGMKALFKNAFYYTDGKMSRVSLLLSGTELSVFSGDVSHLSCPVFDNIAVFPGFLDVHVHLREPGFSYKETIETGTAAAAAGGYTAVCSMPNLLPVPDSEEHLDIQLLRIKEGACISVYPYGAITKCEAGLELSDMSAMADKVIAFSDDGRGVQSDSMMRAAMHEAKRQGKMIVAHCEDNSLLRGGYIHDGEYARAHGHRGICSESEWRQIERDLLLAEETGVKYHICHVSTKESVELIRKARARGVDVTAETAPHYLTLTDMDIEEDDGRFKMNPPLRGEEDRDALIAGILDGTLGMIATDHAPHSREEKSRGLEGSLMGVVGIETAFSVLYTYLVKTGVITLERLIPLLTDNPRARFGITDDPGFTVFDLGEKYEIDPEKFLSRGRSTPYAGKGVFGRCLMTVLDGKAVYINDRLKETERI